MDVPTSSPDEGSLRWLRVLLAASVLAPALAFVASAWMDYGQTLEAARQRVDRAAAIAQEHAHNVLQSSELIVARVEDLLDGRAAVALRADEQALHDRLEAMTRTLPQVQSIWVLDDAGRVVATSRVYPALNEPSREDRPYFQQHRAGNAPLVIAGALQARMTGVTFFTVSRRRDIDGRFAGVIGVSLSPRELHGFYSALAREQPGLSLLLYRPDGSVIARYPAASGPETLGPNSAWMQLARSGQSGITQIQGSDGQQRLVALRPLTPYPLLMAAALAFPVIEREWIDKAVVPLGFALAAMLALGAASWMALRTARAEQTATREWRREATRREKVEQALRESQRMEAMGQLTGGVAHDFNNLLMVVSGNLHILRRRLGAGAHDHQLDVIRDAVGRGVTLTRHLLAFSRRQALQPRTLDLAELMPGLCELLTHSLRENIRLACHVEPGTWPIKADPAELELALLNIAVNARDAMPHGGTLSINARNATVADMLSISGEMVGEYVLISLHDTGEGIAPAILNRVFEPFFTTKEPGKGTGLGLSQVYGFTRQSGGTVTLQSPPTRGTTVTLWLPRSEDTVAPGEPAPPLSQDRGAGHVLVVEDDANVSAVLRELLEQLGYDVSVADNGVGALQRIDAGRFALVLTDVVMLGPINGLELARTLRERHPDLPVLVMTGYAAEIARIAAEGFTVITKPFDLPTLAAAIERKIRERAVTAT